MTALQTRVAPTESPYDRYRSHTATAEGGRSAKLSWLRRYVFKPSQRAATCRPSGVSRSPRGLAANAPSANQTTIIAPITAP